MRVLWLVNVPLPEASSMMGESPCPFAGWLLGMATALAESSDIELCVAFPSRSTAGNRRLEGERIAHYAFGVTSSRNRFKQLASCEAAFRSLVDDVKPQLVHVHGTESPRTLAMVNVCSSRGVPTVLSIQGLVSVCAKHMAADLPAWVVYGSTLRDLLAGSSVAGLRGSLVRNGEFEVDALRKNTHVIGRTTWDRACVSQISPKAHYHFCNETLRGSFYHHGWSVHECDPHTIFVSQGQYSLKGLHYALEAMPFVIARFPKARLFVGGTDITKSDTLRDRVRMTYYGKYLRMMIRRLGLNEHVIFTGPLDESEMCQRFLKSHVFVCPSTIENSSNSLSEAQLLGVPSVASFVGGTMDLVTHNSDGLLYQHDASYMLAHHICSIFENDGLASRLSKAARESALIRADKSKNLSTLRGIYDGVVHCAETRSEQTVQTGTSGAIQL